MPIINFAGLASGIDSNALIDATVSARRAQNVTPKSDKVTQLEDTNDTLSSLKEKLRDLQTLTRNFATLNAGGMVKTAKSSDETVVSGTAASSATNGTYSFTVSTLAKNAAASLRSTAGTYTSSSDVVSAAGAGDVTVTIGTGTELSTVAVPVVANSTTLDGFVTAFNAATTKAVASVVNVGTSASPDYRVMFNTGNEGTLKGNIAISVDAGLTGANAFNTQTVSQATDATFTVSGISGTITRYSNTFSDVIPGVTVNFTNTSSTGITLQIGDDADATSSKVQEFVTAYNDLVAFIKEKDLVERKEDGKNVTNIFGPLADTSVDENVLTSIRSNISASTYTSGTKIRIFADLGLTTERDGTLKFDSTVLTTAIGDEPSSVRQVLQAFGDLAGITGGTIDNFVRFNGLIDVAVNGNKDLITNLNTQITRAEASISKEEESLRARFARLEGIVGKLQQQQSSLTAALAGLGR